MEDTSLAQQLSADDKAYFGEEAVAEALAEETAGTDGATAAGGDKSAETAAAEKAAAEAAAAEKSAAEQKTVPLGALHEERERRKELQAEVVAHRERVARMEERHNQFVAALQRPAPEQPKSVQEDPIAALERHEQALTEQRQREMAQSQAAQHQQQLSNFVSTHEQKFRAETPDYDAALTHLNTARAAEYEALGVPAPQIAQLVHNDAVAIAIQAARMGRSPAELAYSLAKSRGYAPKAAEAAAAATAQAAKSEVSAEEKLAMLEKGSAAAKSLSAGGGGSADLSLEALANMDDDDFSKISDRQWKKLWGAD